MEVLLSHRFRGILGLRGEDEQTERIEELEAELRTRGAEFMVDDGFDEEMTESFLEHVLRVENAECQTVRQCLAESGYVPPEHVPDDRISTKLK